MKTGGMRRAEISLEAITHNVQHLRQISGAELIAVVKANGYGHGAAIVAQAIMDAGASGLGVADLQEAISLRDAGIDAPILCWLHGTETDFFDALGHRIELGISTFDQLEQLVQARAQRLQKHSVNAEHPAKIQLKIDTGLSRNGIASKDWPKFFARAAQYEREGKICVTGLFTHLANAGKDADKHQYKLFCQANAALKQAGCKPRMHHLSASAATLRPNIPYTDTIRVGLACYGLSPFDGVSAAELGLHPALRLKAEIIALRQVSEGTGVSYGFNYRAERDTVLALIPIGYADGMPRALNNSGATVSINGVHRPIVGRIGMDQCVVDLGHELASQTRVGESVVLFGDPTLGDPPVEVWAERLHTINYEVVARLGNRITRIPKKTHTH